MNVEKKQAGILIYETVNGHLFQRLYQGYSVEQAKRLFKDEVRDAKNGGRV